MKLGVIDSGLGGLTVLKRLIDSKINHEYIYFGDNIHAPYGEKSLDEIINYGNSIINFLEKKNVDAIILACGTLSSNKELLKSNIPIIDIISILNNKLDKYKEVSILATPLSIKTNAFKKYINTKLNLVSCPLFVPIIEKNDYSNLDIVIKKYLETTKNSDAILLGCTHYPLIKNEIKKYFNNDIICLDDFIVDSIKEFKTSNFELELYFSKLNDDVINNVKRILNKSNLDIKEVKIDD